MQQQQQPVHQEESDLRQYSLTSSKHKVTISLEYNSRLLTWQAAAAAKVTLSRCRRSTRYDFAITDPLHFFLLYWNVLPSACSQFHSGLR